MGNPFTSKLSKGVLVTAIAALATFGIVYAMNVSTPPPPNALVIAWLDQAKTIEKQFQHCAFEAAVNIARVKGQNCLQAFAGYQTLAKYSEATSQRASKAEYKQMQEQITRIDYYFDLIQRMVSIEEDLMILDMKEFPEYFK